MDQEFTVIYNSGDAGENGLYHYDRMIASWWRLRELGFDVWDMAGWSVAGLRSFAREYGLV